MSNQNFDTFFVGDGSAALAGLATPTDFVSQLSQLFTNSSTNSPSTSFEIENDLAKVSGNFGEGLNTSLLTRNPKSLAKCPTSSIAKIFLTTKKSAYSTFNYLSLLAEQVGNVPIKEEDLIVTENDQYIIEYLKKNRISKVSVENVARLIAFQDMGISKVRYLDECMCPICKVFSGKIFDIDFVMQQVIAGEYLTHAGTGSFSPVIYRESYVGPLTQAENFNIDLLSLRSHEIEFVNVPIELKNQVTMILPIILNPCDKDVVMCGNPINRVNFVNMSTYLKGHSDIDGIVVYKEENVLYIHNSYVGHMGPIEFAEEWVKSQVTETVDIKKLKKCDTYFIKGKKVAKFEGFYYDLETGEKIQ